MRRPALRAETGAITPLVVGLFALAALLLTVLVDISAAHVSRISVMDAADAVARDAADALAEGSVYGGGVEGRVPLTDASVREVAVRRLDETPMPDGVVAWQLVDPTGTDDGTTAVVTVRAVVHLPLSSGALEALSAPVTITVTSRARSAVG